MILRTVMNRLPISVTAHSGMACQKPQSVMASVSSSGKTDVVAPPRPAFAPGCPSFQLQHLQGRFIRVQNLPLQKLPVQLVIDGPQPVLRHPQHPVGHRLPGEHHTSTVPLLFLPVQRSIHHKLLNHNVGNRLWGGVAA